MRSELFLNGTRVDLKEELSAAYTLQIADIREPKTRNGTFSKTARLPGSKTINKLLGHIFEIAKDIQTSGVVNFTPDFNPNLKCTAKHYVDGLLQFDGFMKLKSIDRDQHDFTQLYYNVNFFGEVANIYADLGDAKMADLDLSAYNHTYNKTNQKATWTNVNYGTGYVYPMINYGGVPAANWAVENFYPAVYLKEYIDKIFNYAGRTYTCPFFNTSFFKRLIIPFAGEKLTITSDQQAARLFSAYTTTDTSGTVGAVNPVVFNAETSDPSNQYDTATGLDTIQDSGYYSFYSSGVVTYDAITTVTGYPVAQVFIELIVTRGSSTFSYPIDGEPGPGSGPTYTSGQTIHTFNYSGWSQQLLLLSGDIVQIKSSETNLGFTGTVGKKISANAVFFNGIPNTAIIDGGTLDMQSALPVDVKMADFFTSVLRVFNMYCEPDKENPRNLIIDIEEDFYGTGSTRNWTRKVDSSKTMTIEPMGALNARRYKLKYADDSDYWNKFYLDKWKESYGEKNLDITNDFLKNTEVNEVIFAPTPSIGDSSHDRIIPEIYQLGNSGVQTATRSKLRLLYWGGAKITTTPWNYNSTVAGTSVETTYPYCGHVDDPISPTVDLSFGVPREIYYTNPYGATTYTNNNLYNIYHSKFLSEITDRNSKIVTLYVDLKPLDIYRLSFRDKIFIDGHYYRLQKVIDYDPVIPRTTKVELLKLKQGVSFRPLSKTLTQTYGELFDNGDRTPTAGGNIGVGDVLDTSTNTTTGTGNYVSRTASGITISGSGNRVGDNCTNCTISDSSGVVILAGLRNVNVTNTNDITITESNATYISGNKVQGQDNVYNITTSQTITGAGTYFCTGAITLTLSSSRLRIGDLIIVKRIAGGGVNVGGGGLNIDGAASYALSALYQSVTLKYYGTEYYIL